ncbi:MAG: endonuclease/exonuclease/phosphatase family protein [Deltaproteobacteria bacterium]|nr:endonuclease/exonuclease/phosphatase family protein [Deltaproteobacteria bacterium]
MRIATWNVNGLRARLDFLCLWLQSRRPDVVGLQELKMQDDQLPHEALAAVGYRAFSHGQKSWNGVAILARDPDAGGPSVEVLRRGLPGQEDFGARLMTAEITSDADSLRFTTAYCPNGKHLEHADYAASTSSTPTMLASSPGSTRWPSTSPRPNRPTSRWCSAVTSISAESRWIAGTRRTWPARSSTPTPSASGWRG